MSGNYLQDRLEAEMNRKDVCSDCGYEYCRCDELYERKVGK